MSQFSRVQALLQTDVWKRVEAEVFKELTPHQKAQISQFGSQSLFEAFLHTNLDAKKQSVDKILYHVRKATQLLQPFGVALDVLATGSGVPSEPLWCLLKFVVEVSETHAEIVETTLQMFEQLLEAMPRFEFYLSCLQGDPAIERDIVEIYREFMIFALKAVKLFGSQRRISILFKLAWTRKRKDFRDSLYRVKRLSAAVEDRIRIKLNEKTHRDLQLEQTKYAAALSTSLPGTSSNYPANWKRLHNIPYPRNKNFYGREDILTKIHECLAPVNQSDEDKLSCVTLYGLGGVGKTQIALEYAHRHRDTYSARFWITTDTPENASRSFNEIARKLEIKDLNDAITQARVKDWFSDRDQWLLIFDNTEKLEDIKGYWPPAMNGSILLTSRNPNWIGKDNVDEAIKVEAFLPVDGTNMMENLLKKNGVKFDGPSVTALVSEVGGHPLAICQMSSYAAATGTSLPTLLSLYRDRGMADNLWAECVGSSYGFTVGTVWKLSFDSLGPNARFLLRVLSLLNPEKIPEELFLRCGDKNLNLGSPSRYHAAVVDLKRYSFVDRDDSGEILSIHRLVKRYTLHCTGKEDLEEAILFALQALRKLYPNRSPLALPLTGQWQDCERYISHVISLMEELMEPKNRIQVPITGADLFIDGALYLWERGKLVQGRKLTLAAAKICEESNPPDDLILSDVYSYHACILHDLGQIDEAGKYFQKQVIIRRRRLAELGRRATIVDEIQLANAYNNLAGIYCSFNMFEKSIMNHEFSISLKKRWPKEEISDLLALSYSNLANVYGQQGMWEKSEELFKMALEVYTDPSFMLKRALTLHNFGNMNVARANPKAALPLFEEAFGIRKKALGDHYDTASTLHMMAMCHRHLGDNDSVIKLLNEALRMFQFLEDHLRVARSKYALSLALEGEGNVTAKILRKEAIESGKQAAIELGNRELLKQFEEGNLDLEEVFDTLVPYT